MAVTVNAQDAIRDLEATGAYLVVRRLEQRLTAYLVAAVPIILALIRYLWPGVSDFP